MALGQHRIEYEALEGKRAVAPGAASGACGEGAAWIFLETIMRLIIVFLAIAGLAACGDQMSRTQADIKKGNPEGQQSRKKVEQAVKQGEERTREAAEQ